MDLSLWMIFFAVTVALVIISGTIGLLMLANALPQFRQVASKICVNLGDFVAMTAFLVGLRPLAVELGPMSMALKWVGVVNFFLMGISVIRSIGSVTVIWIEDMSQMSVCKVFLRRINYNVAEVQGDYIHCFFVCEFIRPKAAVMPQFAILTTIYLRIYALLAERLLATICKLAFLSWMTSIVGNILFAIGILTTTLGKVA